METQPQPQAMDAALDALGKMADFNAMDKEDQAIALHSYALGWADGRIGALEEWTRDLERQLGRE